MSDRANMIDDTISVAVNDQTHRDIQFINDHLADRYGLRVSRSKIVRTALDFFAADLKARSDANPSAPVVASA